MKKLILLLMFLVSCAPVPVPTLEPSPEIYLTDAEFYFSSWLYARENLGMLGAYFLLDKNDVVIFATDEASVLQEAGHYVDSIKGYPSYSIEFEQAVDNYLSGYLIEDEEMMKTIEHYYESGNYSDIYAYLYMYNFIGEYSLPEVFKEFFYAR